MLFFIPPAKPAEPCQRRTAMVSVDRISTIGLFFIPLLSVPPSDSNHLVPQGGLQAGTDILSTIQAPTSSYPPTMRCATRCCPPVSASVARQSLLPTNKPSGLCHREAAPKGSSWNTTRLCLCLQVRVRQSNPPQLLRAPNFRSGLLLLNPEIGPALRCRSRYPRPSPRPGLAAMSRTSSVGLQQFATAAPSNLACVPEARKAVPRRVFKATSVERRPNTAHLASDSAHLRPCGSFRTSDQASTWRALLRPSSAPNLSQQSHQGGKTT
ncbi:hypothetical protein CCHR01_10975 [Colletotrichum chrysophilum]|uniref:Uncharacterized protein n=1 Tax=Colletotrichum chrysophilum TaxID=1836956 RepID=A0AAD9AEY1_9PEZI|nr:hypothetical protein CCHR01_10975 [Colletotrichum chrysophilum]